MYSCNQYEFPIFFLSLVHDIFKVHKQTPLYPQEPGNCSKIQYQDIKDKLAMFFLKQSTLTTKTFMLFYRITGKKKTTAGFAKEKYRYHRTNFRRDKPTCFVLFHAIIPCITWIPALVVTI